MPDFSGNSFAEASFALDAALRSDPEIPIGPGSTGAITAGAFKFLSSFLRPRSVSWCPTMSLCLCLCSAFSRRTLSVSKSLHLSHFSLPLPLCPSLRQQFRSLPTAVMCCRFLWGLSVSVSACASVSLQRVLPPLPLCHLCRNIAFPTAHCFGTGSSGKYHIGVHCLFPSLHA